MSKKNIITFIICGIVIILLIVLASTLKYTDHHLRIEGVRVKLSSNTLMVSDGTCENIAECTKELKVGDETITLKFAYKNFKKNGYPNAISGTLNNKEFYYEDGLTLEDPYSYDYSSFANFNVINDKYIAFTASLTLNDLVTTLYIIDLEGNVILKDYIYDDYLYLDDTKVDFLTFENNTLTVNTTSIKNNTYLAGENICDVDQTKLATATYTYTLENDQFTRKMLNSTTIASYIKDNDISCASDE